MEYDKIITRLKKFQFSGEALNALYDKELGWQLRRANKDHTDEIGDTIRAGDYYYYRVSGRAVIDKQKLSKRSLDLVARIVFEGNSLRMIEAAGIFQEFADEDKAYSRDLGARMRDGG